MWKIGRDADDVITFRCLVFEGVRRKREKSLLRMSIAAAATVVVDGEVNKFRIEFSLN